jgi:hypothetical protein
MWIWIEDLVKLCNEDPCLISLVDKIKFNRIKVKYNIVDDIDYFPYPAKFLNDSVNIDDTQDMEIEAYKYKEKTKKFNSMARDMMKYAQQIRKKEAEWPPALIQLEKYRVEYNI